MTAADPGVAELMRLAGAPDAAAPRAIVFDFGGVLFRWQPAELMAQVLPTQARDAASALDWARRFFATPGGGWADYDRGLIGEHELQDSLLARLPLTPAEVRAVIDGVADHLSALPDSVDLLQRLHAARAGTPQQLHYLSNMPGPLADHLERSHAFLRCFDGGVFSARVQRAKPDPAIYALTAERIGLTPDRLLFLDDHVPNIVAARTAGWHALLFTDAANVEATLRGAGWWPRPADR